MKIRTDKTLVQNPSQKVKQISHFWNQISEGWKLIWGPHIHHGFYEPNVSLSPLKAQEELIKQCIRLLDIQPHSRILDVGCGMGATSLYLSTHYFATVHGISISEKQIEIAKKEAMLSKNESVHFKVEDALSLTSFPENSFDLIWSLESCEQFCNKTLFLQNAYQKLKPGGQLMLATWCSDQEEYEGLLAKKYKKLCEAFDLPYMPTLQHYQSLLTQQGFHIKTCQDWSDHVKQSWNIGLSLVNAYSFLKLIRLSGIRGFLFSRQVRLMQEAFYTGRVRYGVFIATKSN